MPGRTGGKRVWHLLLFDPIENVFAVDVRAPDCRTTPTTLMQGIRATAKSRKWRQGGALLKMKYGSHYLGALGCVGVAAYAYWPTAPLPPGATADRIVIVKHERSLSLMNGGTLLKEYRISLGGSPVGAKTREGDGKTPEGVYCIDYRKPDSAFHRALHVSYPSDMDRSRAASAGVNPGGLIMIHGLRNGLGVLGRWHRFVDWTNGCIAVTNAEIEQIWSAVPDGTTVEIRP